MSNIHTNYTIQIYTKVSVTSDNLVSEKNIYTCEGKRNTRKKGVIRHPVLHNLCNSCTIVCC